MKLESVLRRQVLGDYASVALTFSDGEFNCTKMIEFGGVFCAVSSPEKQKAELARRLAKVVVEARRDAEAHRGGDTMTVKMTDAENDALTESAIDEMRNALLTGSNR